MSAGESALPPSLLPNSAIRPSNSDRVCATALVSAASGGGADEDDEDDDGCRMSARSKANCAIAVPLAKAEVSGSDEKEEDDEEEDDDDAADDDDTRQVAGRNTGVSATRYEATRATPSVGQSDEGNTYADDDDDEDDEAMRLDDELSWACASSSDRKAAAAEVAVNPVVEDEDEDEDDGLPSK